MLQFQTGSWYSNNGGLAMKTKAKFNVWSEAIFVCLILVLKTDQAYQIQTQTY